MNELILGILIVGCTIAFTIFAAWLFQPPATPPEKPKLPSGHPMAKPIRPCRFCNHERATKFCAACGQRQWPAPLQFEYYDPNEHQTVPKHGDSLIFDGAAQPQTLLIEKERVERWRRQQMRQLESVAGQGAWYDPVNRITTLPNGEKLTDLELMMRNAR